jgi:hypothetical protein
MVHQRADAGFTVELLLPQPQPHICKGFAEAVCIRNLVSTLEERCAAPAIRSFTSIRSSELPTRPY